MLSREQLRKLRSEPLTKDTSNRIALALELSGKTQVDVAAGAGLTQSYVSRIQNGLYERIPVETTRALAEYFGCAIEDLFPPRDQAVAS